MNIFDQDQVGRAVHCRVEKDGQEAVGYVKWTHAMVGVVTSMDNICVPRTKGWTVLEINVPMMDRILL